MNFLFLLLITAFAEETMTESQQKCLENAESKKAILEQVMGTCKWMLPKTEDAGPEGEGAVGRCSAYDKTYDPELKKTIKVKKKTTYSGSGHSGILNCGSSFNEKDDSYKENKPMFTYQCAECSTSDDSGKLDDSCIKSMYESEKSACKTGSPKMNYRYKPGQDPVPVDGSGKPIK
ncbi:MAG: hypothetical protein IT287_09960 [Bdellovibrionaceae bacterium]|nr:hypothetical protein [Pseudobdellovibrionaceae bacterium]